MLQATSLFLRGDRVNSARRSGLHKDITEYYHSFSPSLLSCVFFHVGNEFFASFFTTETKSRVNFLKSLNPPFTD